MPHKMPVILRAAEIDRAEAPFVQRLNPRSRFFGAWLSRLAGLERFGFSRARIPPGGESYAYHAHHAEEECVLILSGRARAKIDGKDYELGPGDFAAFPSPQAAHLLTNPYDEDCVYVMAGERGLATDVLAYPDLGKSYVIVRDRLGSAFHELGPAEHPFGRADAQAAKPWRLFATRGCGSAIVEAVFALAELPYERDEVDYEHEGPGRDRLRAANPLGQVPTLVLPDGSIMTESAAIALHVDDLVPAAGLLPPATDPLRREALRWLVFLVSAIYPTFTYGDDTAKWVGDAGEALRASTNAHRENLWRQAEAAARGPWFLGARFSVIDVYIAVMTHWRPRGAWFAAHAPKLSAIAAAVAAEPRLASVWAVNF